MLKSLKSLLDPILHRVGPSNILEYYEIDYNNTINGLDNWWGTAVPSRIWSEN